VKKGEIPTKKIISIYKMSHLVKSQENSKLNISLKNIDDIEKVPKI